MHCRTVPGKMFLRILSAALVPVHAVTSSACDTSIFPSCDVGLPVGKDAPAPLTNNSFFKAVRRSTTAKARTSTRELNEFELPVSLHGADTPVLALSGCGDVLHDASVAVGIGGRIQCVLELERLFEVRYYAPEWSVFNSSWRKALETVRDRCECHPGPCPTSFAYGVLVGFGGTDLRGSPAPRWLPTVVESVFSVREWRNVNHHEAHALMGYFSSPFRSAFILSYDGGGNDGYFNAFVAEGQEVTRIARRSMNMAMSYAMLGGLLPEVTGTPETTSWVCRVLEESSDDWIKTKFSFRWNLYHILSFAGKLMGYSGVAQPSTELGPLIRELYIKKSKKDNRLPRAMLAKVCESEEGQRVVAATAQTEFHSLVRDIIEHDFLGKLHANGINVEGIVLTGGCALNVLANQLVRDTLTEVRSQQPDFMKPRDVYVPPAPNDAGLAVGAIWAIAPPTGARQPLQYLGFRLWDIDNLAAEAARRGAIKLSTLGGVEYLAELLAGGPAWSSAQQASDENPPKEKPIIAVVRGRQEFGPRALGHRSLLAVPDAAMRDRMNRLKFRQWYRPVAPMIAEEALEEVFGFKYTSPYMEFAPNVRKEVRERFPGLSHFDGTARHQSVSQADEPWIHALLLAVGRRTGLAVLMNTSFNSKGKPITNTVKESLAMLDELEDLDYVVIEDFLFPAKHGRRS
ncbi:nolO [Symbiodinium sp. CCMP2592]|nr:nolO [Symbiodinium sp. CCMP2592]